jgi:Bacteriophage translational regulator
MEQEEKFGYGVEITLDSPDKFLIIKESLTRIGIKSAKNNTLYQSCHILHRRGKYYVISFLELFALDGRPSNFGDDDFRRRNTIAKLLQQWNICTIVYPSEVELTVPLCEISIIPHKEKKNYQLVSKYTVGTRK